MHKRTRAGHTTTRPRWRHTTHHASTRAAHTSTHDRITITIITLTSIILTATLTPHAHALANTITRTIYMDALSSVFLYNGFRFAYGATLELHRTLLSTLPATILLSSAIITTLKHAMSTTPHHAPPWHPRGLIPTPRAALTITYALAPLHIPNAIAYGAHAQWRHTLTQPLTPHAQHLTPSVLIHTSAALLTLALATTITLGLYEHLYRPHRSLEHDLRRGAQLALHYPHHALALTTQLLITTLGITLTLGLTTPWLAPRYLHHAASTYRALAQHASQRTTRPHENAPHAERAGGGAEQSRRRPTFVTPAYHESRERT